MAIEHFSQNKSGAVAKTNLSAVTSATNGDSIEVRDFKYKSVFVNVSVNTGAVTVAIEASNDGSTWYDVKSETYTATVKKDIFSYSSHFPFMRTTTSTQSNSTVTTVICGGS